MGSCKFEIFNISSVSSIISSLGKPPHTFLGVQAWWHEKKNVERKSHQRPRPLSCVCGLSPTMTRAPLGPQQTPSTLLMLPFSPLVTCSRCLCYQEEKHPFLLLFEVHTRPRILRLARWSDENYWSAEARTKCFVLIVTSCLKKEVVMLYTIH